MPQSVHTVPLDQPYVVQPLSWQLLPLCLVTLQAAPECKQLSLPTDICVSSIAYKWYAGVRYMS